ncbi:phosphoglycerate dehydrogenase [Faecalicatena sp. BF-R-105]|nr:phosphoglycerate dehydrogenase [Faecalicatena sp. BF-R-105]
MKLLVNMNWDVSAVTEMDQIVGNLQQAGYEVIINNCGQRLSEDELIRQMQGMDAFLGTANPFTEKVFQSCPDMRIIARTGVGVDSIDIAAATRHGVAVTTTPGAGAEAVAEYAMAMMCAVGRRVVEANSAAKNGIWNRFVGGALFHKTLGILGTGNIGRTLASIAKGFDMRVIAYDEYPNQAWAAENDITYCETMEQVLRQSDFVSIHVPLMPSTENMIRLDELKRMKPSAYLINCARGGIVNETDLYQALREKVIAGAGLDVFVNEPVNQDNPLLTLDNCVCSTHNAGSSLDGKNRLLEYASRNLIEFAQKKRPFGLLNPDALK